MHRGPRLIPLLMIVFATPFLMGTEKCEGGDAVLGVIGDLLKKVRELDHRVTALEKCDCEGVLEPVCGENGWTYVNACEARCAEVEIESGGLCPVLVCGGDTGETCEEGSFCDLRAGCDETQVGRCVEVPDECSDVYRPVCGCDGETYANNCERLKQGVGLDHVGECKSVPVACDDNDACADDEFCSKRGSVGEICDTPGVCQERPDRCSLEAAPVCGCDGKTYLNQCEANANGTSAASRGPCRPAECGGKEALECEEGEVCFFEPGVCRDDPSGVCVPEPETCPDRVHPVCSCDGETYDNACIALKKGVVIESRGECEEPPTRCESNDECGADDFCAKREGDCDGVGACRERPQGCPDVWMPVCGCDGKTYGNSCDAAARGVNVAHPGECRMTTMPCGGIDQLMCDDGYFCRFDQGGCSRGDVGVCMPVRECSDRGEVCGCDEMDYASECAAVEKRVRVAAEGACVTTDP